MKVGCAGLTPVRSRFTTDATFTYTFAPLVRVAGVGVFFENSTACRCECLCALFLGVCLLALHCLGVPAFFNVGALVVVWGLFFCWVFLSLLESLILAQDERWWRA